MTFAARMRAPGWYRAALGILLGTAFGFGLDVMIRALWGYNDLIDGKAITTVCLLTTPFGFLIGLGAFDYWFRWAAGKPTIPEEHSQHGAHSWKDYFYFNTDHKVIGIQYIVTTFFFFFWGGAIAMLMRAELENPTPVGAGGA